MIELPNDRILSQFTYYRFKIGINTYNISNRNRNRLITRDWLDDDTIFCFMSCLSNQYSAKIFVIESFQINNIFECGSLRFNIYEDLSKYDFLSGPLLLRTNHWVLVFINLRNYQFSLLDPMCPSEITNDTIQAYDNWVSFANSRLEFSKIKFHLNVYNHTKQEDAFNCGPFICKFFSILCNNTNFSPDMLIFHDDINFFRKYIDEVLFLNSDYNFCSKCISSSNVLFQSVCCNHHYHYECGLKIETSIYCPLCIND